MSVTDSKTLSSISRATVIDNNDDDEEKVIMTRLARVQNNPDE